MSFTKYSVRVGTLNEKLDAYQGDRSRTDYSNKEMQE